MEGSKQQAGWRALVLWLGGRASLRGVCGRGRDSTYYLVDCVLSQAYTRRFSAREGAQIAPGRLTGGITCQ